MPESPVKELNELTRLRIELRAAKDKRTRKPLFRKLEFNPWLLAILGGASVYTLDRAGSPEFGFLLTYFSAVIVAAAFAGSKQSLTDERFTELERSMELLDEKLKNHR